MARKLMRGAGGLVAAWMVCGCSHSASFRLKGGHTLHGEIVGGTRTSILVRPTGVDESEPPSPVDRDDVEHILHPGTLPTIIGGLFLVAGVAVMSYGIASESGCQGEFCGFGHLFFTIPGAGVAGISAAPTIWGIYAWGRSGAAAGSEDGWTPDVGEGAPPPQPGVVVRF